MEESRRIFKLEGEPEEDLNLWNKDNPHAMWKLLKERYVVVNVATKVQLQYQMARLGYSNQSMSAYIDQFLTIFNKLAAIGSPVDDDTKVATLLATFGDKSKSPYGKLATALQATDSVISRKMTTARLLQEYSERSLSTVQPMSRGTGSSMALNLRHGKKYPYSKGDHLKQWKKRVEK